MSGFPEALTAHLARDVTSVCLAWKLTRSDGAVSGFTDHDRRLVVDGVAYEPETGFSASEARSSLGLAVDTVDVEGALSSAAVGEADIAAGRLDGARIETLLVNWREPAQFAVIRTAAIGRITRRDGRFVAELESLSQGLDQRRGRIVARDCDAELGDSRCRFALATPGFAGAGAVTSVETAETFSVSGLGGFAAGWFGEGVISWTGGPRLDSSDRVIDHRKDGSAVRLTVALESGPAVGPGDGFSIVSGCDKRFATCKAKFANAENFRGFPHLPGNDAAYAFATQGGEFDGGPLVP